MLSPLLIAAAFIAAASYQIDWGWDFDRFFSGWSWSYKGENVSEIEIPDEPGTDTLAISLDCGDIGFEIQSVSGKLFSARSVYQGKSPYIAHSGIDNTQRITYEFRDRSNPGIFNLGKSSFYANFGISDRLPVKLDIHARGKSPEINLAEIRLIALDLFLRSEETLIWFGDLEDSIEIRIDGRTENLVVNAPAEMGFAISGDPGQLDRALLHDDFTDSAAGFRSIDFEESSMKAYLFVNARVESIEIARE